MKREFWFYIWPGHVQGGWLNAEQLRMLRRVKPASKPLYRIHVVCK